MQKKLLTLAVASALAMPAVALAQVTLYGSIDGGIRQQNKVVTATGTSKLFTVQSAGKKTNRWGMTGSEDLGGGLKANFTLEGGFATDTGLNGTGLDFARTAIVGLSSGGNRVDIGRNYTLNFRTQGIYDPLSHDYGISAGGASAAGPLFVQGSTVAGTRADNSITAAFRFGAGGFALQFAPGEVAGDNSAGRFAAINGDMTFGPVTVGAAWSNREALTGGTSTDTSNIGAAWKMGPFTLRGGMGNEDIEGGNTTRKLSAGVQYDISPTLEARVSYYDVNNESVASVEVGAAKVVVVNLEYKMSKRTIGYLAFDRKAVSGIHLPGTVGSIGDGATGFGAGISHSF